MIIVRIRICGMKSLKKISTLQIRPVVEGGRCDISVELISIDFS